MKRLLIAALLVGAGATAQAAETDVALVKRGEYLARAGDCVACHTAKGGKPFAGGLAMPTPIGTVYSTNITPDASGIGHYSFEAFDQAVRKGIGKDGSTLYPAMPYPSYARVTDEDMQALYAYFMKGVEPVAQPNRATDIPWPLSMRWPLAIWRGLFAPEAKAWVAPANADPVVSRGAYLVEGLGHCGACHTPRALTMQEKALNPQDGEQFLAGSAPLEGWIAKNLRGDHKDGLGNWSEEQLVQFLKTGRSERSAVFGGMSDVVEHSLQYLTDADLTAIARYLKTLPPSRADDGPHVYDKQVADALWKGDDSQPGASIYIDNCAACHRTDGHGYTRFFPALAGNPVLQTQDPTSLIHVVLAGGTVPATHAAPSTISMPAFGWRLSDQEVAEVVSFIRSSWGNQGAAVTAADVARLRTPETARTAGSDTGNANR
ncbi:c-type cytochrome [Pseudomonas sp. RHF3.3-3]|uniref:Cytochrome c, mono-and diheme variants family n=2 Tax=Pseudomonas asplenii TaxID=53407 RepID=A0A0N0VJE2_9PSED|nr:cytochrome c [Pseudomonas fuscovaginae]KPA89361.1 cytochrome c, mono- and diheme variants family [Pseudomonas fuscovaginae]